MQIILDSKDYDQYYEGVPNVAYFFTGKTQVYSYEMLTSITSSIDIPNIWQFALRTVDSKDLAHNLSAPNYPVIHNITYTLSSNTVAATCTSPTSPNTTFPCFGGVFNPNNYLTFNITNLRSNETSSLHAIDSQWTFEDAPPSAVLEDRNGNQVLRTDAEKPGDCTQLKLCAAQEDGQDVVIPIGLFFIKQIIHATTCTDHDQSGENS